jgi:TetR/AcrR family transcriptional regulator, repressor of fatR-cypB operon
MTPAAAPRVPASKREAILDATLRLVARTGLHNTPVSAIAREAGVAVGTAYLYFSSKDELINSLYLELVRARDDSALLADAPADPPREALWRAWERYARWHLDHRDAANFILQCESSGIISEETLAQRQEMGAAGLTMYREGVDQGMLRDVPVTVFWAHFMGPILVLSHLRDVGEIEITDEILHQTFEGVARSVLEAAV